MFQRSRVRLLSGTQIFSLSHSRVMLIYSGFTQSFMLDILNGAYKSPDVTKTAFNHWSFLTSNTILIVLFTYNCAWLITSESIHVHQIIPMLCFFWYHRLKCCTLQPLPEIYLLTKIWATLPTTLAPKSNPCQSWWLNCHQLQSKVSFCELQNDVIRKKNMRYYYYYCNWSDNVKPRWSLTGGVQVREFRPY